MDTLTSPAPWRALPTYRNDDGEFVTTIQTGLYAFDVVCPAAMGEAATANGRAVALLPDLAEALAGWIATAAVQGASTGEFGEWAAKQLAGTKRTPAQVTREVIAALEGGAR